eukprot:6468638-Amphidinium_carterae.1
MELSSQSVFLVGVAVLGSTVSRGVWSYPLCDHYRIFGQGHHLTTVTMSWKHASDRSGSARPCNLKDYATFRPFRFPSCPDRL